MGLKILTFYSFRHINKIELKLKYIQDFEKTQAREANIFKAIYKQQRSICHDFRNCLGTLNNLIAVNKSNSNNDAIAK